MNLKNLQIRKRILSVVLAMGFSLCPSGSLSDIISYNSAGAKLVNGLDAKLFFTTGTNDDDYAYVSFDNKVGYIYNRDINYEDFLVIIIMLNKIWIWKCVVIQHIFILNQYLIKKKVLVN